MQCDYGEGNVRSNCTYMYRIRTKITRGQYILQKTTKLYKHTRTCMCIKKANKKHKGLYIGLMTDQYQTSDSLGLWCLGSNLIIFSSFLFFRSLVKNDNINRNQKRTTDTFDVVYFYSLIFFRILELENIAKILTTGPRLGLWLIRHDISKLNLRVIN